jgi:dynein assembly factor 3
MSKIVEAWSKSLEFEVEKYRDQRLRYHYKERYDFRTNLIDWDYNTMILEFAPIIHYYHYREWRQTGVAYENRFSVYSNPNRTLSSYIPGKKNSTKESCLVRGYWGDIVCSPYFTFGV